MSKHDDGVAAQLRHIQGREADKPARVVRASEATPDDHLAALRGEAITFDVRTAVEAAEAAADADADAGTTDDTTEEQ